MKETNHDYQGCLVGNFYDSKCTGVFNSWDDFKNNYAAFNGDDFDDRYHYVFRYDIYKNKQENYDLELCIMLQRKGIYTHIFIKDITQDVLDNEIMPWLKLRYDYIKNLWCEVSTENI